MEPAACAEHITYRQLRIRGLRIHAPIYGAAPVIASFLNGGQPEPAAT